MGTSEEPAIAKKIEAILERLSRPDRKPKGQLDVEKNEERRKSEGGRSKKLTREAKFSQKSSTWEKLETKKKVLPANHGRKGSEEGGVGALRGLSPGRTGVEILTLEPKVAREKVGRLETLNRWKKKKTNKCW